MDFLNLSWYQQNRAIHVTIAVLSLSFCACIILYGTPYAGLIKLLYPFAMGVTAFWLFSSRPALFLGFAWWMWLTIPFVRRIVEWETGYDGANLIMTAPIGATILTLVTVFRFGGYIRSREFAPYGLAIAGVIYALLVGLPKTTLLGATLSLMEWLMPIALGFHLHVFWRMYPQHKSVLRGVFRWGIMILGVYGILQFLSPMPWDVQWMIASGMESIGRPEPYEVRVFSMLNAPGPFASVMMAGLIVLFADSHVLGRLALAPGLIALLLSLVRAAWGGWIIAAGYMAWSVRGRLRKRLLTVLTVAVLLAAPLAFVGPIASTISSRAETIASVQSDNSFGHRLSFFRIASKWVLTNPIGAGLGSTGRGAKMDQSGGMVTFDSGILAVPYTLGWLGGGLYFMAIFLLMQHIIRIRSDNADLFTVMCAAITVSFVVQLAFANTFTGLKGILFWTFAGLAMAGRKHFETERQREEAASYSSSPLVNVSASSVPSRYESV